MTREINWLTKKKIRKEELKQQLLFQNNVIS
jgi:hypothetical protein